VVDRIRIQRQILRRTVCDDMGFIYGLYRFSPNIVFYAYAVSIFMRIIDNIIIDPLSSHTVRRRI